MCSIQHLSLISVVKHLTIGIALSSPTFQYARLRPAVIRHIDRPAPAPAPARLPSSLICPSAQDRTSISLPVSLCGHIRVIFLFHLFNLQPATISHCNGQKGGQPCRLLVFQGWPHTLWTVGWLAKPSRPKRQGHWRCTEFRSADHHCPVSKDLRV